MRPKHFDFDPANANDAGLGNDLATGTTFTLTANDAGDGLAHQLVITTSADETTPQSTATLVGTDADGRAQTDTIALGSSAAVESTKYFKTLTALTADVATTGTIDVGWVDEVASQTIPLDFYRQIAPTFSFNETGAATWTLQMTLDDVQNGFKPAGTPGALLPPFLLADQEAVIWFADDNISADTANILSAISDWPVRAVRLLFDSYTDGAELQMTIVQAQY